MTKMATHYNKSVQRNLALPKKASRLSQHILLRIASSWNAKYLLHRIYQHMILFFLMDEDEHRPSLYPCSHQKGAQLSAWQIMVEEPTSKCAEGGRSEQ